MAMDAMNNTNTDFQRAARVPENVQMGAVTPGVRKHDAQIKTEPGKKQPSADEIKSAISSANKRAHFGHTSAEFSYHEATKRISVKIVDEETNEVIREIPPEETLEMISKMWELAGIMVDERR